VVPSPHLITARVKFTVSLKPEAMKIFTIAVIPNVCEESSLNGCKAKSLSWQIKLDFSLHSK